MTLTAEKEEDAIKNTKSYESQQNAEEAIESALFAHQLLDMICERIVPGVSESEIKKYAQSCFDRYEVERIWHQPYIRFGDHTLLTYREKTDDDYRMGESDIAFVDIGVVRGGIEGDAGRTVVTGNNSGYMRLRDVSEFIFMEARDFWRQNNPSGVDLYDHIHQLALKKDVLFNLDPAGHLIGEFPHRGWKAGLNNYPEKVQSGAWILEIQICDNARQYGAFFEDLLY